MINWEPFSSAMFGRALKLSTLYSLVRVGRLALLAVVLLVLFGIMVHINVLYFLV